MFAAMILQVCLDPRLSDISYDFPKLISSAAVNK